MSLVPDPMPQDAPCLALCSPVASELAPLLREQGWHVMAAGDGLCPEPARSHHSGESDASSTRSADVLLLDARRSVGAGAPFVPLAAPPCVALIDGDDAAAAAALFARGALHVLPWPVSVGLLDATMRAAAGWTSGLGGEDAPAEGTDKGLLSRAAARLWLDQHLSGVGNRMEGGAPAGLVSACLLIGISQFDSINAAYGTRAGDAVLAHVSALMAACVARELGERGRVARMGGTEFLVMATASTDPGQGPGHEDAPGAAADSAVIERARALARTILAELARPFAFEGHMVRLTARCGIANPARGDDAARLLRRASAALADARRSGSSDIWVRSGEGAGIGGRTDADRLDADLRLAIDRGEIAIVYQPQYEMATDRLVGVEALARWNHPRLGLLDAGTLFRAADRSDYLLPLSLHIQRRALSEAGAWSSALASLRLSINVTAADLAQEDFLPGLMHRIERSGFPHDRLTVEITETGLIENIDRAAGLLADLHGQAVRVAIDDFGTGYSSLAYLKALHPDYLKIDYGLSRDIVGTARDRIIVRGIIAMARSLNLPVIAEGVESEEQRALLAHEGCAVYQGFLRSRPVTSEGLERLMSGQPG